MVDSKREITIDAIERFLTHVVENKPENNAPAAAESTFRHFWVGWRSTKDGGWLGRRCWNRIRGSRQTG
jgi:hypothetical protein